MTDDFPAVAKTILGPLLDEFGFSLDAVDDDVDEGGRRGSVVYYRTSDCKLQIYQSAREGSVNCMIAPLDAPNVFGPGDRARMWQYLTRFTPVPDVPLKELLKDVPTKPRTTVEQLERLIDRIAEYYPAAHTGILEMSGN